MQLTRLALATVLIGVLLIAQGPAAGQMTPYKALRNWARTAPLTGYGTLNQPLKRTGLGQNLSTIENRTFPYELTADRKGVRHEAEEDGTPDPRAVYANAEHTINSMLAKDGGEKSAYNKFLTGSDSSSPVRIGNGVNTADISGSFFDDIIGMRAGSPITSNFDSQLAEFLSCSNRRLTGGGGMSTGGSLAALGAQIGTQAAAGITTGAAGGFSTMALSGGRANTNATQAAAEMYQAQAAAERMTEPGANVNQAKSNEAIRSGISGSNMGETAREQLQDALNEMVQFLLNVGNESTGVQTSSHAVTKTYANVVWMVQQMFQKCYLPMAILLVLPGALLTNMKSLVGFQFLHLRDEDTQGPFTGILRATIAVFLIPTTQLFVSYVIDTANGLQATIAGQANVSLIFAWASEQIQTFGPNQQGKPVMNLPIVPRASYRGKLAGMPVRMAMLEQMSYTDLNMVEITNEVLAMLTQGIAIISGFQIVFISYLYLLGPIAAAFFAWPGLGRDLFRKAFTCWMDGVVIIALWKFWWDVVLVCMTVWLQQGDVNPYDPVNVYYLLAFEALLLFVPFSPFDFKPGEIVTQLLNRAQLHAFYKAGHAGPVKKNQRMV